MKFSSGFFLLLCLALFQYCNTKNEVEVEKDIHQIEISKEFLLDHENDLQFKAIDTIELERPGNPPLSSIQYITFAKDYIFLLDRKQGLLKFDHNGNFIQTIGKKGDGPDEYNVPTSIYLDEINSRVLLADWEKRVVNSFDLEGNFIASSKKLPGRPISFYKENDKVLVIQEGIESYGSGEQTVLLSFLEPTTLEFNSQETPLYSFYSRFYRINTFLKPFGKKNENLLFYIPRVRFEGMVDQKDTIYRVEEDHLIPEYQLDFTDFGKSDTIRTQSVEINDGNASILIGYKKDSYHLILDLENSVPTFSRQLPRESYSLEVFPKHLTKDTYYSIIKNMKGAEEKNPKIVMYALTKE